MNGKLPPHSLQAKEELGFSTESWVLHYFWI